MIPRLEQGPSCLVRSGTAPRASDRMVSGKAGHTLSILRVAYTLNRAEESECTAVEGGVRMFSAIFLTVVLLDSKAIQ